MVQGPQTSEHVYPTVSCVPMTRNAWVCHTPRKLPVWHRPTDPRVCSTPLSPAYPHVTPGSVTPPRKLAVSYKAHRPQSMFTPLSPACPRATPGFATHPENCPCHTSKDSTGVLLLSLMQGPQTSEHVYPTVSCVPTRNAWVCLTPRKLPVSYKAHRPKIR